MDRLEAISPIDGRYRRITESLAPYFSESALINHRLQVEGEYLIYLSDRPDIPGVREFTDPEKELIRDLYDLSLEEAQIVKDIEVRGYGPVQRTNHDVNAVVRYLMMKLQDTSLADVTQWVHFPLTSEDVTNLAYGMMLGKSIRDVIHPAADELYIAIDEAAKKYAKIPMLARTHGQPASPTTVGKEFAVFAERTKRQLDQLAAYRLLVKLNCATGNYNALVAAYPDIDCTDFTRGFIDRLSVHSDIKFEPNLVTTQIEPHDTYAELFGIMCRLNNVLIDFDTDVWQYISDEWFVQRPEIADGSSTMPNKVNPIDFENSEGNLSFANAIFEFLSRYLPVSRLQRDLSDSTVERITGTAFGHSLIGYNSTLKGLGKTAINEQKVVADLEAHPEVLAEALQIILRREGKTDAYDTLKALTRGRKVTMEDFGEFIDDLDVPEPVKDEMRALSPTNYTGIAEYLAQRDFQN